ARASDIMTEVLRFLGLPPDDALRGAPPAEQLAWATSRWDIEMLRDQPDRYFPATGILAAAQ
ncbi:MAG: hypothetical protein PVG91_10225, partial [Gammaproteobacteria bacterium]